MNGKQEIIAMGCDHAAYPLKETIKDYLENQHHIQVIDAGTDSLDSVDYPDYALAVSKMVSDGTANRGILLCGTGLGMSMAANKFSNIRAALCNDLFSAIMSRRHNNANILIMGGRVIGESLALEIVNTWLETPFDGGRHQQRIDKFDPLGCAI